MTPNDPADTSSQALVDPSPPDASDGAPWHVRTPAETVAALGVDPAMGLDSAEVRRRRERHGANRLAESPPRPRWLVFVDQFRSGIVAILAGAAVLAGLVGDLKDTAVIAFVLLANAVLGYVQQRRASDALAALKRMLASQVRVRRDGVVLECDTEDLVPGDIVLLDAGDRVPADGRLLVAINLSIDESSLTGESVPVDKSAPSVAAPDASVGDRHGMVFMNTTVTRGRAEVAVTTTGMATEMGTVAEMLATDEVADTPLQRQLDRLSKRLAFIAAAAVSLVFILQLAGGADIGEAALGAVALAVAAIPEGLPAVVTVTLAIGTARMAQHNAIVRRLHSVETLGSTSVICSDKTGTLTLNQMTAREFVRGGAVFTVTGEGYGPDGELCDAATGAPVTPGALEGALLAAALCSDAVLRSPSPDGDDPDEAAGIVGDPTEAALVVLAAKAGIDAPSERARRPRLGEVPFDSTTKFMATFHAADPDNPAAGVLMCVKGAPDVLLARATAETEADGSVVAIDAEARAARQADNNRLASTGMRVLAVATRRLDAAEVLGADGQVADPERWVSDLVLEVLVGIVDPPRPEARRAIALCRSAGIGVKMITGDHASTAAAIGAELGIVGDVVTGDELSAMDDEELVARIDGIGVCARVSPEHKVRVVSALQRRGHTVAMTGDGVNDAPALRRADIGVAMGLTGTEVTKEAGDMVLTDDNFATIVAAVERGRTIYDNIIKFVRFQLATNMGAIAAILGASLLGLPVPFSPLQVLWVNLIADGPPAMTLGLEGPEPGVMARTPVPGGAPILTLERIVRLVVMGLVMAVGVLGLFVVAREAWGEQVALTMAFTTFVLQQMVNVFNSRLERHSVFSRFSLTNGRLWAVVAGVVVLQVLAISWGPLQSLFGTEDLAVTQWGICAAVALTVLVFDEVGKVIFKFIDARRSPAPAVGSAVSVV
jgi:P-type Ca2+ transporter type 2C